MGPGRSHPIARIGRALRGHAGTAAFLTVGCLAAACTSHGTWETWRRELERLAEAGGEQPEPVGPLHDLRGAIHVHTHLSHDSEGTLSEILRAAHEAELDFVALTDHETPAIFATGPAGEIEGVILIRGMEVNRPCFGTADRCPSLLALGLSEPLSTEGMSLAEVVAAVRAQGGLPFVAHPRGWSEWSIPGLTGLEIYDVLDDALDSPFELVRLFFDFLRSYDTHPDEVFLSMLDRPEGHLEHWDELLRERAWVGIAGNDAHQNIRVFGRLFDPYARSFRFVTTHVWASARSEAAILEALAAGRAYVAFELLADARGFRFEATRGDTVVRSSETIERHPSLRLRVRTPLPARILVLRDGQPVGRCECRELRLTAERSGPYRVEAQLHVAGAWRPWILSNPIFVR